MRTEPTKVATRREKLWELNARAAKFYQEQLASPAGSEARAYLERRGLKPETIKQPN